jgi:hypothetical protein
MSKYDSPTDAPTEFHQLLLEATPVNEHGNRTILHLSEILGVTRWAITKWILNNRIPARRAKQIVDLNPDNPKISLDRFEKYVYGD